MAKHVQGSLFESTPTDINPRRPKSLPFVVKNYVWHELQNGRSEFTVEDTQDTFQATAQQVSKAVRRFNEAGRELNWPGFHFSARVLGPYSIKISAEQVLLCPHQAS